MGKNEKGCSTWYIPDGYIPTISSGALLSHESICVLNCSEKTATLTISVYFEDRDPLENLTAMVPGRRTKHIRTSSLQSGGVCIPVGVPYAMEIHSDIPVIIQYSRLDSTQAENALMTAIAYPMN